MSRYIVVFPQNGIAVAATRLLPCLLSNAIDFFRRSHLKLSEPRLKGYSRITSQPFCLGLTNTLTMISGFCVICIFSWQIFLTEAGCEYYVLSCRELREQAICWIMHYLADSESAFNHIDSSSNFAFSSFSTMPVYEVRSRRSKCSW